MDLDWFKWEYSTVFLQGTPGGLPATCVSQPSHHTIWMITLQRGSNLTILFISHLMGIVQSTRWTSFGKNGSVSGQHRNTLDVWCGDFTLVLELDWNTILLVPDLIFSIQLLFACKKPTHLSIRLELITSKGRGTPWTCRWFITGHLLKY